MYDGRSERRADFYTPPKKDHIEEAHSRLYGPDADHIRVDEATMEKIRRVVKYEERFWEGMHLTRGHWGRAGNYARSTPEGIPRYELKALRSEICRVPNGQELYDLLSDAVHSEVDARFRKTQDGE